MNCVRSKDGHKQLARTSLREGTFFLGGGGGGGGRAGASEGRVISESEH